MGSVGSGETLIFISPTMTTIHYRKESKFQFPTRVAVGPKKGQTKEQWCLWVSSSGHWAGVHVKSGTQQPGEEDIMVGQAATML